MALKDLFKSEERIHIDVASETPVLDNPIIYEPKIHHFSARCKEKEIEFFADNVYEVALQDGLIEHLTELSMVHDYISLRFDVPVKAFRGPQHMYLFTGDRT